MLDAQRQQPGIGWNICVGCIVPAHRARHCRWFGTRIKVPQCQLSDHFTLTDCKWACLTVMSMTIIRMNVVVVGLGFALHPIRTVGWVCLLRLVFLLGPFSTLVSSFEAVWLKPKMHRQTEQRNCVATTWMARAVVGDRSKRLLYFVHHVFAYSAAMD